MKKYLNIKLLSKAFLFVIVSLLVNCQKEDTFEEKTSTNPSFTYKVTSLNELTKLKPVITNVKKMTTKTSSFSRDLPDVLPLENIDETKVIQYTDSTGYSTYTFKIINEDNNSINFENLYLLETEQGYIGYILSYEPDQNWYDSHLVYQHGEYVLNMNDYVGDITKYSFEREVIWSTKEEYSQENTSSRAGGFITECIYTVERICTEGNHSDSQGWDNCTATVYDWVESCHSVWSSGGGSSSGNGTNGDGSSTGGGGDGSSDTCNTSGTSVVNNQPLAGVNNDCAPNEGTGVFPEITETVCQVSPAIYNYVIDCLDVNSFTQPNIANWINNPANGCQVGNIASFISQNGCSEETQEAMIIAITSLSLYTETNYPGMELNYEFEWWLDNDFVENNFNFGFDAGGGLDNLTAEEKVLVVLYPAQALIIRENREPAETETVNRFGDNGINDKSDAFRHAFFNAMNSNDAGDIVARKFSNAHESETPSNLVLEKQMDLYNNSVGHNIGNNASSFISDQELSNLVYQSLIWGSLKYLFPINYSDPNFWDNPTTIEPNDGDHGITSSTQLIPTNQ